jgi:hypothetical protein
VRLALGEAITEPGSPVDSALFAMTWKALALERLPDDFDWAKLGRRYQTKARGILRESPELRAVLDSQAAEATAQATQRMAGMDAGFDTSQYAEGLRKRYAYLRIENLDPSPDHQRIALTKIFVEPTVRALQQFNLRAYELPVEHRRRLRQKGALEQEVDEEELQLQREAFLQQPATPALEALSNPANRLCVILGDPGSGKSMLLDYLAMRWAELKPSERESRPLPLLIELKTYAENLGKGICKDFLEYLDHGVGTVGRLAQHELNSWIQRGNATLLIDGLDEVFDPLTREMVAQELVRLTTHYPRARLIVTSRSIGYDFVAPVFRSGEFQHYFLQDLDAEQQESFIGRWHELAYTDPTERLKKSERLRTSISNVAAISELAQNPLLLTLMALLNRHQELPRDRNELYEQASKLMLQQWDASKVLRDDAVLAQQNFDHKDKQAMLRAVAFKMQTSPQGLAGNVITSEDLEETLAEYLKSLNYTTPRPIAVRLIQQLRERNFILCLLGDEYFAFVHRTFLEFFCAWAWVWKFEKEKGLTFQELKERTFDRYWPDEKWHEVLRLIAARLEPQFAGPLISSLLTVEDPSHRGLSTFLAAKCYSDLRNLATLVDVSKLLENKLKTFCAFDLPYCYDDYSEGYDLVDEVRISAVHAFASCWPHAKSTIEWLKDRACNDEDTKVQQASVHELASGWKNDPDTLLWLKDLARNEDVPTRLAAVRELARGWKDDPETLPLLKNCACNDGYLGVRLIAVEGLARGWKHDKEALRLLKDRACNDKDRAVRLAAVEGLARGWKDDPGTLPLLKDRAWNDEDDGVRLAAVQELARGWKNDSETLVWLKDGVRKDGNVGKNVAVRLAALRELARGWKDDKDTLPWLKDHVRNDQYPAVRKAAVRELAHGWKDDKDTLSLLKDRAHNDENPDVRWAAVQELARGWKEDPETLPLLKDRALNDEHTIVRRIAVQELARGWKGDQDTLPWLKDRGLNDEDHKVRVAAVQELARGWKDDQDTLPWLKDRGLNDRDGYVRWAAVEQLARGWKGDKDTLPWLKDRAVSDEDQSVRRAAVHQLARGWRDDRGTSLLLKDCARTDAHRLVRFAAVQELGRGWKDDPDTLPLLKDSARNDEAELVRKAAVEGLARGWRNHQDTLALLKDRALNDESSVVRSAAVLELAHRWKDDPATLPLLKDRACNDEYRDVCHAAAHALARGWKDDPEVQAILKGGLGIKRKS